MKDFEYYNKPQVSYPNKDDYTTRYCYDNGELVWEGFKNSKSKIELIKEYPRAVYQDILNEEAYTAHRQQYGEEKHKLVEEFINDLFVEFGVEDNPKREAVYALAYEYGHSNGYSEIYNYFSDLVNLIKD